MELHSIKGGNEAELYSKQYTLGVGISLGNKWFTVENIVKLVQWSFLHTKDYVIVYVADSIHAINIEVRKSCTKEKALRIANKMGDNILQETKDALRKVLDDDLFNKVRFVKWNEIVDDGYKKKLDFLYKMYNENMDFRNAIFSIVKNTVANESRVFTDERLYKFGEYIIEELPEVLTRTPMQGIVCDAYAYPQTGDLVYFVDKLQQGLIFPEIKNVIIDTEPKVFLEVR